MFEEIIVNKTILNSTDIIINTSQQPNATIRLIIEIQNTNFPTTIENTNLWYDTAIGGVIVGVILTLLITIISSLLTRKKELVEYEYRLLLSTNNLMNTPLNDNVKSNIKVFADQISLEPKFHKIQSGSLVADILAKLMKGENVTDEVNKISERLNSLKKYPWLLFWG